MQKHWNSLTEVRTFLFTYPSNSMESFTQTCRELSPVRQNIERKLYYQMIKENLLAKFSLDQQNLHKKCDSIEDDLRKVCLYDCVDCSYGSMMFNLLASVLVVHWNLSISNCYLCNALLTGWSELMEIIKNSCLQRIQKKSSTKMLFLMSVCVYLLTLFH